MVVVAVVTDVHDLISPAGRDVDHPLEEAAIRLRHAPLAGRADVVHGQTQRSQELGSPRSLVAGDAHPQASSAEGRQARPHVRIQIAVVDLLPTPSLLPQLSLTTQVKTGAEVLERLGVVPARRS